MYNFRLISVGETLSTMVRQALFDVYKINNGELQVDDLGAPIRENPSRLKNKLLRSLRDMERPEDLDTILDSMEKELGNE